MPLTFEGQVMVRGLVMGPGTDYDITYFNPFSQLVKADYTGTNPYGDGSWSGPEWVDSVQIPLTVVPRGGSPAGWWALHTQLLQALRPIRDEPVEAEIHWRNGNQDFMMYARPRAITPEIKNMRTGDSITECSLLALDPSIYSGGENGLHELSLSLYTSTGGLGVPFGLPVAIQSQTSEGVGTITNVGITPASLYIRIEGPVVNPKFVFSGASGNIELWFELELAENEWLEIDTEAMSVLQNGFISRLAEARGIFAKAGPGETEVKFTSDDNNMSGTALIQWRDRW